MNMLALGGTTYLLRNLFNVKGAFISPQIKSLPTWNIPGLNKIPILSDILNNHPFIVYVAIILAFLIDFIIFHTKFGLRLRATGEDQETSRSLGINPNRIKFSSILLSGIFFQLQQAPFFRLDMLLCLVKICQTVEVGFH